MEPMTAAAAAALVMKYVLPAVKTLGEKAWGKSEDAAADQAADAAVEFGRRLLRRLVPHRRAGQSPSEEVAVREQDVVRCVGVLAAAPDDAKTAMLAEGAVEALLAADPGLLAAISGLLAVAPKTAAEQGDRSVVVGRDNTGMIVTGDRNTVQR